MKKFGIWGIVLLFSLCFFPFPLTAAENWSKEALEEPGEMSAQPEVKARAPVSGSPRDPIETPEELEAALEAGNITEEEIRQYFDVDTKGLEEALSEIDRTLSQQGIRPFLEDWFNRLRSGEISLSFEELKQLAGDLIFYSLKEQRFLLGQLLVLVALSVFLQQLGQASSGQGAAKAGQLVSLLLIMTIAISTVKLALSSAQTALNAMGGFMEILVPLLMAVMFLLGQGGTVMLMRPMVLGAMSFFTAQIRHLIFPLILIYLALVLADALVEGFSLQRLNKFIKQVVQWGVGLTMTLFTAILTIGGSFAAVSDGLSLRTAKFFFGNLIPVAGKLFADVLDTAAGSALLLKNTMGVAGMIAVLALTLLPLLRIFIQAFLLRLVGAVVEPLGDKQAGPLLEELGNVLMLIFTVLGAITIMTILSLSAILLASNTAVMFR